MNKVLIGLVLLVILIAGCTQTSSVGSLSDLPNLTVGGMKELGDLPDVNTTVDIGAGAIGSNPFPDKPSLQ